MQIVNPTDELRNLHRRNVEVYDEPLLATACQHTVECEIVARVDFLVRNVRRDVDEIALRGFCDKLEMITPTQASQPVDDLDDALEITVVVRARLGFRIDRDGTGPELASSSALRRHGGAPVHA